MSDYKKCNYVSARTNSICNRKVNSSKTNLDRQLCYYHHWQIKNYYNEENLFKKTDDEIKEQRPKLGRPKGHPNKLQAFEIYNYDTKTFEHFDNLKCLKQKIKQTQYIDPNNKTNIVKFL